jgi:predicted ATPase
LLLGEQWLAFIHLLRGEGGAAVPFLERAIRIATEAGIPRGMWANFLSGWAMSGSGRAAEGLSQALSGFDAAGAAGQEVFRPYYTGILADMCRAAGRMDEGMTLIDKALDLAKTHDSPWCLAELHRIKGELMRARGEPAAAAEPYFETAVAIARRQSAKSWELRAATGLARLRHSQGRSAEAHDVLAPVYAWFTEGFDSADLKEAKAVLERISNGRQS